MSAITTYQYKIYCITESQYVSGWGTSAPTVCYNNNTHTVNSNSVQIIQTVSTNAVIINQDQTVNTDYSFTDALQITNISPNSTQTISYTYDINTIIRGYKLFCSSIDIGDTLSVVINPNTSTGLIAQNVSAGATVIYVNPLAISVLHKGFFATITDGTNTDDLGKILSVDSVNNCITIQNATTHSFSTSNAQVKVNFYIVKNLPIYPNTSEFGAQLLSAKTVPAGTVIQASYTNSSGTNTKSIAIYLIGGI